MARGERVGKSLGFRGPSDTVIDPEAQHGISIGLVDALPTPSAGNRGLPLRTAGSNGVADVWIVPLKDASDSYVAYRPLLGTGANTTVTSAITFLIDGGGSAITPGEKGNLYVPYDATITAAHLLTDGGSIQIDIWKAPFAAYPPTDDDSITHLTPLLVSTGDTAEDTTLAGWITAISAGDTLRFNVDTAATTTQATVTLTVSQGL